MTNKRRHKCPRCERSLTCHIGPSRWPHDTEHRVACPVHGLQVAAWDWRNDGAPRIETVRQRRRRKERAAS